MNNIPTEVSPSELKTTELSIGLLRKASPNLLISYAPQPNRPVRFAITPQIIITIVSAAKGLLDGFNQASWEQDVSNNIKVINAKLDEILKELHDLKIWYKETLDEEVRQIYATTITTDKQILEQYLSGLSGATPTPQQIEQKLQPLLTDIERNTLNLASWRTYGFSHYNEVAIGFSLTLVLLALTGAPKQEIHKVAEYGVDYFSAATDPNNDKSFAAVLNDYSNIAISSYNTLNSIIQGGANGWYTVDQGISHSGHGEFQQTYYTDAYAKCSWDKLAGLVFQYDSWTHDAGSGPKYPWFDRQHQGKDYFSSTAQQNLSSYQTNSDAVAKLSRCASECNAVCELLKKI